jgi:hypothetical protein
MSKEVGAGMVPDEMAPAGLREHIKRHTDRMVAPPEVEFTDKVDEQYTYPAIYGDVDPRDKKAQIVRTLVGDAKKTHGATPFGLVTAPDWLPEWLEHKEAIQEEELFEKWFGKMFNMADPIQKQMSMKLLPEFWDRREELLKAKFDVMKRAALINLRGPQTKEDLIFLYGVNSGKIVLPTGDFWLPGQTKEPSKFHAGIFNIWSAVTPTKADSTTLGMQGLFNNSKPDAQQMNMQPWYLRGASNLSDYPGLS